MRNAIDLIAELEDEGSKHTYAAIAVGFAERSIFVGAGDENRFQALESGMREDGIAVGLIMFDRSGPKESRVEVRVFPEHDDAEFDALSFLQRAVDSVVEKADAIV